MIEVFAAHMKENGWSVEWNETQGGNLSEAVINRYGNIPKPWMDFIRNTKCMISADEAVWFLCAEDFGMQDNGVFRWNEWELISLEGAGNDTARKDEIKRFWDDHLPIVMSVRGCYSYYAIAVKDGFIVHGAEPEFEECEIVSASFPDFVDKILKRELRL